MGGTQLGGSGDTPDTGAVDRLWEMAMRTSLSALDAVLGAARAAAAPGRREGTCIDAALDAAVVARRVDEAAAPFATLLEAYKPPAP